MDVAAWITFYVIGIIILLGGGFWIWKKIKLKSLGGLVLIFVVSFVWYLPVELSREPMSMGGVWESVFYAVLQGISVVKIDNYSRDVVGSTREISLLFNISIMILRTVAAFFIVFGLGELFVRGFSRIGNTFNRRKKTYILFGANEKTVQIAKSICESDKHKKCRTARIIFLSERVKNDVIRNKIKEHGGILYEERISERLGKFIDQGNKSRYDIEVFLFEEDENENLANLGIVREIVLALPDKKIKRLVRVYTEINTAEEEMLNQIKKGITTEEAKSMNEGNLTADNSEEKGDMLGKKNLVINCVQTRGNFIKNTLLKYSIFENALSREETKIVKALIIGSDQYCFDFFRHILELCQMPGYMLELTILGDEQKIRGNIMTYSPGLLDTIGQEKFAQYQYSIIDISEYESEKFANAIRENDDFSIAFISSGNSEKNRSLSYRILKERSRVNRGRPCRVLVNNSEKATYDIHPSRDIYSKPEAYKYLDAYKVNEIGNYEEIYSYKNITASKIDSISRIVHKVRNPDKDWESYSADEYKRRSVYARTVSLVFKVEEISAEYNAKSAQLQNEKRVDYINRKLHEERWLLYEHMRWNVNMMSSGFVYGSKKDLYAKIHYDLVDYDTLCSKKNGEENKGKDKIEVDVNCLAEIDKITNERK